MPLLAHLDELRRRLVRTAIGVAVVFVPCYWKAEWIFALCDRPYREVAQQPLAVTALAEAFFVKLRVAFLASLFLSSPWILWQAWGFIRPALHPHERRFAVPFVAATTAFFLAGGAFAYFVGWPAILDYLIGQASAEFQKTIRAESYIQAFGRVLLGMALVFEAPVLAFALARFGLVEARTLLRYARHAIVGIAVVAAVITPSGDIPTMVVFAVPMTVLYFACVLVAWVFRRRDEPRGGVR